MSPREVESPEQLFNRTVKRQRAREALRTAVGPGRATRYALCAALLFASVGSFFYRSSIPSLLAAVGTWLVVSLVTIAVEQSRIARRLEAVIELLDIDNMGDG